jgi:cbb3-type cytochrome oxidase subunit 3
MLNTVSSAFYVTLYIIYTLYAYLYIIYRVEQRSIYTKGNMPNIKYQVTFLRSVYSVQQSVAIHGGHFLKNTVVDGTKFWETEIRENVAAAITTV